MIQEVRKGVEKRGKKRQDEVRSRKSAGEKMKKAQGSGERKTKVDIREAGGAEQKKKKGWMSRRRQKQEVREKKNKTIPRQRSEKS